MYQGLGSRPFDTGRQRGGWLCVNIRRVCFAPRYRTLTVQRSCGSHSARHRPSMGIQYPRPRVRQIGHSPSQILTPPGMPIIQASPRCSVGQSFRPSAGVSKKEDQSAPSSRQSCLGSGARQEPSGMTLGSTEPSGDFVHRSKQTSLPLSWAQKQRAPPDQGGAETGLTLPEWRRRLGARYPRLWFP